LSRLATSFVLGYHGCDRTVGERAILEGVSLLQSDRDYDWLGPGAYFWESDPVRALEWAHWHVSRGDHEDPYVIGAVIDLGNCLDLVGRENLEVLRAAHDSYVDLVKRSGLPMPENKPAGASDPDRRLRYLDCAVIRYLHTMIQGQDALAPYDTVRGMFAEGVEVYPGSGFRELSHVQIAVCNNDCIKGLFVPLPYPRLR
jgi:hypothetical protein